VPSFTRPFEIQACLIEEDNPSGGNSASSTALVGEVGGVGFKGRLLKLGQLLVVLVEIGKYELLLGHVQLGVLDAHPVLPVDSAGF
jgi:hypothetical protein